VSAIRMLAVDLDGTLLAGEDAISPRTREALHAAARAGVQVAIATGRRWRRTRLVVERLGLPVPAVCLGGALVKGPEGATVRANAFPSDALREVAALVAEHGLTAVGQRDGGEPGPDFVICGARPWNGFARRYWERNRGHAEWVRRLADEERDDLLVVGAFGAPEPLEALAAELHARWPGRLLAVVTDLPSREAGGAYCEIVPARVSKWSGLCQLAAHLGVPDDAICAVGDERNDLAMIRGAAWGVAMGNAHPEVLAAADWVTGRSDEDGLVAVVERILGGEGPSGPEGVE